MPEIKITDVVKRWKDFYGSDHITRDIPNESFVVLLGPSGCGKTTLLRRIAGLETPTSGEITIGDEIVFSSKKGINVPPNKRRVGFLFQNYALWPNRTVYQNIQFGLKNIKKERPETDFDYLTRSQIVRILSEKADRVVYFVKDSVDKKGKINEDVALIKLIDNFTISRYTAKEIYALHLEQGDRKAKAEAKIKECQEKRKTIAEGYKAKGIVLNERGELTENGVILRKKRGLSKEECEQAIRHVARIVKVEEFRKRYPNELSGGQQQRVAIARTLAPEPKVIFMDEPLSNLDAKLRLERRSELKRLHVETGATFVYVTHDQLEARTLASRICLINNGSLQQYDAPLKVYSRPNNLFVADFVGNPAMTLRETKVKQREDGTIECRFFDSITAVFKPNEPIDLAEEISMRNQEIADAKAKKEARKKEKGYVEKLNKDTTFNYKITKTDGIYERKEEHDPTDEDYILGVRPEFITLAEGEGKGRDAVVYSARPSGRETTIKRNINGFIVTGVIFGANDFKVNEHIKVGFKGNDILLFDKTSEKLISAGSLDID